MKVNQSRYGRSWGNHQFESLLTFIQDEADRKEYPKQVKRLKEAQIKCAELLIKHGCKVNDLTTGEQACSPTFFAVQSNSHDLAEFLLKKTTTIEGSTV